MQSPLPGSSFPLRRNQSQPLPPPKHGTPLTISSQQATFPSNIPGLAPCRSLPKTTLHLHGASSPDDPDSTSPRDGAVSTPHQAVADCASSRSPAGPAGPLRGPTSGRSIITGACATDPSTSSPVSLAMGLAKPRGPRVVGRGRTAARLSGWGVSDIGRGPVIIVSVAPVKTKGVEQKREWPQSLARARRLP